MSIPNEAAIRPLLRVGRYEIYDRIASGGMAAVHVGMLMVGQTSGMARPVAIKRLHPHLAKDPEFVAMFLDEAKLAARLSHQNIVPTLDVITQGKEVFLVMEYVAGESLATVLRTLNERRQLPPIEIVTAVVVDALQGLSAAHRATTELGRPLGIVHRDISPQNVMVGADGLSRLLDFGIAKAADRAQYTREGQIRGKIAYLAPEQLRSVPASPRTDLFSMGVVLWESLTARQLFQAPTGAQLVTRVLECSVPPASQYNPRVTPALDELLVRALNKNPEARFQSADEMAAALEAVARPTLRRDVGAWLQGLAGTSLDRRSLQIQAYERSCAQRQSAVALPAPEARSAMPSRPQVTVPRVSPSSETITIPTLLSPPSPAGQQGPPVAPVTVIVPPPVQSPARPQLATLTPLVESLPDLSSTSSWPRPPYQRIGSLHRSSEDEGKMSPTSLLVAQGRAWVMPTRVRQALAAQRAAAAAPQGVQAKAAAALASLNGRGHLPSRRNGGLALVTGLILGGLLARAFLIDRSGESSSEVGPAVIESDRPAPPVLAPTDLPPADPPPKRH